MPGPGGQPRCLRRPEPGRRRPARARRCPPAAPGAADFGEHQRRHGARRIAAEFAARGEPCGPGRVARRLEELGGGPCRRAPCARWATPRPAPGGPAAQRHQPGLGRRSRPRPPGRQSLRLPGGAHGSVLAAGGRLGTGRADDRGPGPGGAAASGRAALAEARRGEPRRPRRPGCRRRRPPGIGPRRHAAQHGPSRQWRRQRLRGVVLRYDHDRTGNEGLCGSAYRLHRDPRIPGR